jgi:hypothetical protein
VGRRLLPASSAALHAILSPTQAIDPRNVLRDSEDLTAAAWRPAGVAIERLSQTAPIAWRLHKTREGSHVGVRQLVTLTPSSDYVVSAQFRASNAQSRPGLYGETPGGTSVEVTRKGGVWTARASGKLEVASLGTQPVDGGWVRVVVGLHTTGDTALSLYLGPAVDRRSAALGTSADVRALQVERGPAFTGYRPATEESWQVAVAAEAAVSRLRFWSIALNGFSQHPWTGLGIEQFAQRYRAALPEDQRGNVVPVHPHSLALAVAFDAGVPGLLGLVLLLTGIVASMRSAPRGSQLRHLALGTLVALLVANLFDFTFFHSSLFYPLCALAGWCRPQEQRSRIP